MIEAYRYRLHLTQGDDIRLIALRPGQGKDPLSATTRYCSLSEKPEYQALSYTWGNPLNTELSYSSQQDVSGKQRDLYLDGTLIKITQNLCSALRRVRKVDDTVVLWVDAICIDQSHDEEKSWQIRMMREIYENASLVVIWLGPSDESSDMAMHVLQGGYRHYLRTSSLVKIGEKRVDAPPAESDEEYGDQLVAASMGILFGLTVKSSVPIPPYPIEAVAKLLNRAYWGRGWCWQEFTVATKASILCGSKTLHDGDMCIQVFLETWDRLKEDLGRQPHGLDHRPWSMMELRRSYRNIVYLRDTGFVDDPSIETPPMRMPFKTWAYLNPDMTNMGKAWTFREAVERLSLKELLREASMSWLRTSDDYKGDQIFALVGMATDAAQLGITIDCALPWEKVYSQTAIAYRKRGDLWFLNHCQGTLPNRSWRIPSWVPDWSQGYHGSLILQHFAPPPDHLGTLATIGEIDLEEAEKYGRLRLQGIFADEVEWVSRERFPLSVNDLGTAYRRKIYQWIQEVAYQCRSLTRRDVWTVMIANSTNLPLPEECHKNATDEEKRQMLDNTLASILNQKEPRDERSRSILESFLRCFMQATAWRCMFRTRRGRLGLAQTGIRSDDHIVALMGSDTAFIIRRIALTSEDPRYRIMCECYIHGVLDNESLKDSSLVKDIVLE